MQVFNSTVVTCCDVHSRELLQCNKVLACSLLTITAKFKQDKKKKAFEQFHANPNGVLLYEK